jgi:hypothetical protein
MKNTPNKIFLNIGTDEEDLDFNTLSEVTWSKDRVFDSDLEFISVSFLLAEIDKLKDYANATDDYEKAEFAISILKNLLK